MKEEYDASFSVDKEEYKGEFTIPDANKNLTGQEKINSVKRHIKSLAKRHSGKEVENLKIRRKK